MSRSSLVVWFVTVVIAVFLARDLTHAIDRLTDELSPALCALADTCEEDGGPVLAPA